MGKLTVPQLAKMTGLSKSRIYQLRRNLGRTPTVEEIMERKGKSGAPTKEKADIWAIQFIGKKRNFEELMAFLKNKYGENATIAEIIEKERKETKNGKANIL